MWFKFGNTEHKFIKVKWVNEQVAGTYFGHFLTQVSEGKTETQQIQFIRYFLRYPHFIFFPLQQTLRYNSKSTKANHLMAESTNVSQLSIQPHQVLSLHMHFPVRLQDIDHMWSYYTMSHCFLVLAVILIPSIAFYGLPALSFPFQECIYDSRRNLAPITAGNWNSKAYGLVSTIWCQICL